MLEPGEPSTLPMVRLPIDDESTSRVRPPHLGEHSAEVLRENGFTDDEISTLLDTE
jgi:crotonobetainyl-CoA:carnitine CoA-transferase CaiB-like acyl-CoA transferase